MKRVVVAVLATVVVYTSSFMLVFLYLARIHVVASFVVNQVILPFFISNMLVF